MPSRHSIFLYCKNFVYFSSFRLKNDVLQPLSHLGFYCDFRHRKLRLQQIAGCRFPGNSPGYAMAALLKETPTLTASESKKLVSTVSKTTLTPARREVLVASARMAQAAYSRPIAIKIK